MTSLQEKMNMISHQAVREDIASMLVGCSFQNMKEKLLVFFVLENALLIDPAEDHMINSTLGECANSSGHLTSNLDGTNNLWAEP